MMQTVLALETSCDESAAAVVRFDSGNINVLSNCIASQVNEHALWGGVVPEIASRRHLEALPFLINDSLRRAKIEISSVDAIAATVAPGLTGSLLIGSITARTLAGLYGLPFLGIHHLEGHLASASLSGELPAQPYLVLLVSGGHTELIKADQNRNFLRLGHSHDDAAGEAFDKVARLLGLPYPGGPAIEELAQSGDPFRFRLPKGKVKNPEGGFYPYSFSFSGLKTAMLRLIQDLDDQNHLPREDLAASFQRVVAEVLVERSIKCALQNGIKHLVIVGGVAANLYLRELVHEKACENSIEVSLAPKGFCTDNAAMIGAAALSRLISGRSSSSFELGVSARMPLENADLLYGTNPPF